MVETFDSQFGPIKLYRGRSYRRISLKFSPSGDLKLTAPLAVPKFAIGKFLENDALEIERMIQQHRRQKQYLPGMAISKTCLLKLEYDAKLAKPEVKIRPNFLVLRLPFDMNVKDEAAQHLVRAQIPKILRREAKEILVPRLKYLAKQYNFKIDKISLGHNSSRWGSCRADTRTINLNIALVTLDNELIDYVLIHELCHLRQMNHGVDFWAEVGAILPNYRVLDKKLKQYQPHL